MSSELPPYLTRSERGQRQRRARRGRLVWAVVLVLVVGVAVAVVLGFGLLEGKKSTDATTTSLKPVPSTSTTVDQALSTTTTTTSLSAPTTTSTATSLVNGTITYSALLSGQNEIPAVSTSASGTLTLTVAADGSSVHYVFMVNKIANLTLARLRQGKTGTTGATLLTIYGGPTRSDVFTGVVTEGSFTADQLGGSLRGKTIADFVNLIKAGAVYLNVGTTSNPSGEIRGQLK
jgi:hypothetical protein